MAAGTGAPLDEYRAEVEAMLAAGRPIAVIERMLERAPLDAEERSALWSPWVAALQDALGLLSRARAPRLDGASPRHPTRGSW